MFRVRIPVVSALIVVVCVALGGALVVAQSVNLAPGGSELTQLLAEVRGLRADLRETTAISARTQVLLARIQLQEQRIVHLDQERSVITNKRQEVDRIIANMTATDQSKGLEEAVARGQIPRDEAERALAGMRMQVDQQNRARAEFVAQEDDLLSALAAEQARWSDFNGQLDALESTLGRSR